LKLSAPQQLPPKSSANFDNSLFAFYRAAYQMWNALQTGNIRIVEKVPASATDDGEVGDISFGPSYIYICIQKNTWRRIAHATW
jgi:hypothetical protein